MLALQLPAQVEDFLKQPNAAVLGCIRPDGFPMTLATWYDWEDGKVLVNMENSRARLGWMRLNPKVSLTVLAKDWYRHVSLYGLIVAFEDDPELVDIDRLSQRYRGQPYARRHAKRVSAWIEPHGWHGWDPSGKLASERKHR